jgi:hypothetical protein
LDGWKSSNSADIPSMNKKEKMAFYINAYNAFTIKRILDHYPVASILLRYVDSEKTPIKFN